MSLLLLVVGLRFELLLIRLLILLVLLKVFVLSFRMLFGVVWLLLLMIRLLSRLSRVGELRCILVFCRMLSGRLVWMVLWRRSCV